MTVLLIEDNQVLSQMYQDEFRKSGVELTTARDGKTGIVKAIKDKPDFILMDIMLGGMDGITVFRHLQELPETKNTPIAFLTVVPRGVPEAVNKDPQIIKGAVGYWSKDEFTPMEIVEKIKEYLKNKSAQPPGTSV